MAENKDGQEKTEPASSKRLEEARLRGQVSKSMDVTTAAIILFGILILFMFGSHLSGSLQGYMKDSFSNLGRLELTPDNIHGFYTETLGFIAKILLPIIGSIFLVAFFSEVSQIGIRFSPKKFTEGPQLKQLKNPFLGLKKIFFSGRAYFELMKSLAKVFVLGFVVYTVLDDKDIMAISLIEKPFIELANLMSSTAFEMIIKVGSVYAVIAIVDHFYQKYRFKEDMKMTKQEVKEESKQAEGDPKVKAQLRSLMRNRVRKLMMQGVEEADVVITNPTHFAVALEYKKGEMSSPKIVAKGADFLAQKIRDIANEKGIPIVEEPPLARTLFYSVDIGQEIPEKLFKAVAQILAYVYHLNKERYSKFG